MATEQATSQRKDPQCIFPLSRYCFHGPSRHYYPFGNVPAEDLLENCIKTRSPSVLVLGCGDIRSCFYTLWKNFDSSISNAPKRFDGARFVLNDCSAPIIARNVIFLYLCTQFCGQDEKDKKLLCSMWAIWYCHELHPSHSRLLNTTLENLVKFAESHECWSSHDNPLHRIVQFTTRECLSEVGKVWRMWLNKTVSVDSDKMNTDRLEKHSTHNAVITELEFVNKLIYIYGNDENRNAQSASMLSEVHSYFKNGSCYAEEVLGIRLPAPTLEVNVTMYERIDGKYTCHYNLLPFQGYFHSVDFSTKNICFEGPIKLNVLKESFDSQPYLANSVQQYGMWVLSSSRILKDKDIPISFTFDCRDAVQFCQDQVQPCYVDSTPDNLATKYDIISTSNLIDHVGLPNLVLAGIPLLTDNGLLITTTLKMRQFEITGEHFINTCFGFKCELLPVLLGIQCIGYDGRDYSNPVFVKPSPPDLSNIYPGMTSVVRTFLWIKQPASQNLVFPRLPPRESGNVTNALIDCVTSCSFALTRCGIPNLLCASIGVETAMAMLKCFFSQLEGYTGGYEMLEPLCCALKQTALPFLHCLQTQMLLHNIHAHLTLSENDCPLCNKQPLNETLGLFQLNIDLSTYDGSSLYFVAYVHSQEEADANVLHMKALEGQDVHIFDSFAVTSTDDFKVKLDFFAPLFFSNNDYNIALVILQKTNFVNKVAVLQTTPLKSVKFAWKEYTFQSSEIFSNPIPCSDDFRVVSHAVSQSNSETTVVVACDTSTSISSRTVTIKKVSSAVVNISCGSLKFQLCLSYPIKYKEMRVRVSQSSKSITISCKRQPYSVAEDRPCLIVSPSHPFSIVPMQLKEEMIKRQAEIQISLKEGERLESQPFQQLIQVPEMNVKIFLKWLFENVSNNFFLYSIPSTDCCCLILVNNLLFDYNHRTPAIDLAFYFLPDSNKTFPKHNWSQLLEQIPPKYYHDLSCKGCHFLKEVLFYFARRTNGMLQKAERNKYLYLYAQGIDGFFTRAVVYYLSIDPDLRWTSPKTYIPKCAHCKAEESHLVNCSKCEVLKYCNLSCQRSHNSEHHRLCAYIRHGTYTPCVHISFINVPFLNFH